LTVPNGAIEIDRSDGNETIFLPGMGGPFRITRLAWIKKNVIELEFDFDRGGFAVTYRIHYDPARDTIWFEDLKSLKWIESGGDYLWYRISGPGKTPHQ
jgi:hypothetical protein